LYPRSCHVIAPRNAYWLCGGPRPNPPSFLGTLRPGLVNLAGAFALPATRPRSTTSAYRNLPGPFRVRPLQLHRGLNRLDALVPGSNGLTERSLEALIGFDQPRVLLHRRGNRRLQYKLVALVVAVTAHRLNIAMPSTLSTAAQREEQRWLTLARNEFTGRLPTFVEPFSRNPGRERNFIGRTQDTEPADASGELAPPLSLALAAPQVRLKIKTMGRSEVRRDSGNPDLVTNTGYASSQRSSGRWLVSLYVLAARALI